MNNNIYSGNGYPANNLLGPQQRICVVSGKEGANTYKIGPDSNAILLDSSGTMIWVVATDGAGYRSAVPYDIIPHKEPEPPDYNALLSRISKMEELLNGFISATNTSRTNTSSNDTNTAVTDNSNAKSSFDLTKQF